jgi:hypothetical protein
LEKFLMVATAETLASTITVGESLDHSMTSGQYALRPVGVEKLF